MQRSVKSMETEKIKLNKTNYFNIAIDTAQGIVAL
jgi:hypothetical protein